jgi:uncharacterized protein YbcI
VTTVTDAGGPPDRGVKLAAISTLTVRLFGQYTGRGPTKARTSIDGDMVIVVLHDTLTTAELALVAHDQGETVLGTRRIFHNVMRAELIAGVQQILQRDVVALLGDNHIDPDIAIAVFILAPSEHQPPSGAHRR